MKPRTLAAFLVRDLINTPAGDMGPAELASAAVALARRHKAKCAHILGLAVRDVRRMHSGYNDLNVGISHGVS